MMQTDKENKNKKESNNTDNRDASYSMNGYHYQRNITMLYALEYHDKYVEIEEEEYEDTCFTNINNKKILIQTEYLEKNETSESITHDSGLYKTIVATAELDVSDIQELIYYMHNKNGYQEEFEECLKTKQYKNIGYYIIFVFLEELTESKNNTITINLINNYDAIKNTVELYKQEIENYDDENLKSVLEFENEQFCVEFFSELTLEIGNDFFTVEKQIMACIESHIQKNNIECNNMSDDFVLLILDKMYAVLTRKMFSSNKKILMADFLNTINNMCDRYGNNANYFECYYDDKIFNILSMLEEKKNLIINADVNIYSECEILFSHLIDNHEIEHTEKFHEKSLLNYIHLYTKILEYNFCKLKDKQHHIEEQLLSFIFLCLQKTSYNTIDNIENKMIAEYMHYISDWTEENSFDYNLMVITENNSKKKSQKIMLKILMHCLCEDYWMQYYDKIEETTLIDEKIIEQKLQKINECIIRHIKN